MSASPVAPTLTVSTVYPEDQLTISAWPTENGKITGFKAGGGAGGRGRKGVRTPPGADDSKWRVGESRQGQAPGPAP